MNKILKSNVYNAVCIKDFNRYPNMFHTCILQIVEYRKYSTVREHVLVKVPNGTEWWFGITESQQPYFYEYFMPIND